MTAGRVPGDGAPATLLNFSYGSNLLSARMRERVPSARVVGSAVLRGHVLRWHKAGQDGSAKCDIVHSADVGACVHGVVYEIDIAEKPGLDRAEGLGAGYDEKQVCVSTAAGALDVWVYHATRIDAALAPFCWYRALVVAGAREHGLPADVVAQMERVPCIDDPDRDRADRHFALVRGGALPRVAQVGRR